MTDAQQYLWMVLPKFVGLDEYGHAIPRRGLLLGFTGSEASYTLPFLPGQQWRVSGLLLHHGNSTNSGHYTTWLHDQRGWIHTDCMEPTTKLQCCHNTRGLKDVVVILWEKVG